MRDGGVGRWLHRWAAKLWRTRPKASVAATIAEARKASEAMQRPTRHNPDAPDADLRYIAGGPLTP
jgi:hypothetical protein